MSPQLATVATMLLIAVLVLTNTVSTDGSIGGVYAASIRLAEQTGGTKGLTDGLKELVGSPTQNSQSVPVQTNTPQKPLPAKPDGNQPNNNSERKR
jgi:hypothetical protein